MITSQSIQNTYDRWCSLYDLFFKPWLEFGRRRAIEKLDLGTAGTVLEIGVGTGLSFEFYPPHVEVIGFDFSHGMLKCSTEKTRTESPCPIHLLQMDVQSMAFPEKTFDRILAAYVMTVVPDIHRAIEEILRVGKPGARVVFINHLRSPNPLLSWIEDTFHPLFAKVGLFTLDRDLLAILESFHLEDLEIEPTSMFGLHHLISFKVPNK